MLQSHKVKAWLPNNFIEKEAYDQVMNLTTLPFLYKHVAVMPDAHAGKGSTVSSVIPTKGAVIPAAVGVDIGCGMLAVPTNLTANDLPDNLRFVRDAIENAVPVGFNSHPSDTHLLVTDWIGVNNNVKMLLIKDLYKISDGKLGQGIAEQLGTLGGGNHFIEICLDEADRVWIMLHSGSRGIGNRIGQRFIELARKDMEKYFINLPDKDLAYLPQGTKHFEDYLVAVEWAQHYASRNRQVMLRLVVTALKTLFPSLESIDEARVVSCHHNYVSYEHHYGTNIIVTRKGAVSAREGQLGIIPGSMGTKSYIVRGKGNQESFCSYSHGAGRVMSRTKARAVFTLEDHARATQGVECRKDEGVLDETPGAYKDIDAVMEAQKDLVDILHTLRAVVCVKG